MTRRVFPIHIVDVVVADPCESPTAQMIINRRIVGNHSRLTVADGVEFIEALARNYRGTYLRCSKHEEEQWILST